MILKRKTEKFTNDYGYVEEYDTLVLEKVMSGHLYYGSGIETYDTCGNCDGGRCHRCQEIYILTEYNAPEERIDKQYGYSYQVQTVKKWSIFDREEEKKQALALFD